MGRYFLWYKVIHSKSTVAQNKILLSTIGEQKFKIDK